MRASEFNEGIATMQARDFRGGKSSLVLPLNFKNTSTKLPGGSGFVYTITPGGYSTDITIWDPKGPDYINAATKPQPDSEPEETYGAYNTRVRSWNYAKITPGQLIGKLEISSARWFPLPNAVAVDVITVDEDYRGQGIAKALYGIVLTIMKLLLVAGDSQTPGGRRNWVSLASIPGVEMKGYVGIEDYNLTPNSRNSRGYQGNKEQAEKNIDTIMGKLGGDYIGRGGRYEAIDYFAFDVQPNSTGKELEAYVKTQLSKIYGETAFHSGLYAIWSGA
jgi:GNAT superfamily N-acetyltransferase